MQTLKKIIASVLILILTLMLINIGAGQIARARSAGASIGQFMGFILVLFGLLFSTRWRLKLAGRTYKVGRQAFAVLWFCESVLGILIGLTFMFRAGVG